jgi:hypothetical protein
MNATEVIGRIMQLTEFTVTTRQPGELRFNGVIPFDMSIVNGVLTAKVLAVTFDEAAAILHNFLSANGKPS